MAQNVKAEDDGRLGYRTTRRDRLAHGLSNLVLNVLATREYRAFVRAAVDIGVRDIERELRIRRLEERDGRLR